MSAMMNFLQGEDWDAPFFKRLAHNDTGQAVGHQGGIVVPKDLREFFPSLDGDVTSAVTPTVDRRLRAEMYSGTSRIADATVRYQIQTWGGTRNPESRITDNLGPIRNEAEEGDLLLFQRRADAFDRFRFILVKRTAPEFTEVDELTGGRRWGVLMGGVQPVSQPELVTARDEIVSLADKPFELVKPEVSRLESRQTRIARSSVFREKVRLEYRVRCCVSGIMVATPTALYEVESAHVVPLSEGGTDDIRNGLALAQTLHWAFDRGLFGVLADRTVYVPRRVGSMKENAFLKGFHGRAIVEAKTAAFRVHPDALKWHFESRVRQWE